MAKTVSKQIVSDLAFALAVCLNEDELEETIEVTTLEIFVREMLSKHPEQEVVDFILGHFETGEVEAELRESGT